MHVPLHFAERAFTLHLLLQGLQRLVDIIVAHENLNDDLVLLERRRRPLLGSKTLQRTRNRHRKKLFRMLAGAISEPRLNVYGETRRGWVYKPVS